MNDWNAEDFVAANKQYVWHPFTSMHDWCAPDHEPLILAKGHGGILRDTRGREYIDGIAAGSQGTFVCEHEEVFPDVMVLDKGLTRGYLPFAITLLNEKIFQPFCEESGPQRTRQCGFLAGVEIEPGQSSGIFGAAVSFAAGRHGLLTRPIRDVIVLMPPFCITLAQLRRAMQAIRAAIIEVCENAVWA